MVTDSTGSYLVDQLLRIMSDELLDKIFTDSADSLLGYALHHTANFVLQKLMERLNTDQVGYI